MREIKFRGIDKTGNWAYGFLSIGQDVNFWEPQFECAVCGEDPEAMFYYI